MLHVAVGLPVGMCSGQRWRPCSSGLGALTISIHRSRTYLYSVRSTTTTVQQHLPGGSSPSSPSSPLLPPPSPPPALNPGSVDDVQQQVTANPPAPVGVPAAAAGKKQEQGTSCCCKSPAREMLHQHPRLSTPHPCVKSRRAGHHQVRSTATTTTSARLSHHLAATSPDNRRRRRPTGKAVPNRIILSFRGDLRRRTAQRCAHPRILQSQGRSDKQHLPRPAQPWPA